MPRDIAVPNVVLILILLGLLLRTSFLDAQPLWWDEGYSVYLATEPAPRALALTASDIHPPLYYLLLQAWFALVGVGVFQARFLSVLLGAVAIPLFWLVGRRLTTPTVAAVATALFALAPFHIYYAQEVRMYALLTCLALLTVWALVARHRRVVGLALLAALLVHYYAAFLALAVVLVLLYQRVRARSSRAALRTWVAPALFASLAYLPWLLYALPRLSAYVDSKVDVEADVPLTLLPFLWRHLVAFSLGHLMPQQGWLLPLALIFLGLALVGGRALRRRRLDDGLAILLFWLVVPMGAAFVVNLWAPFADARIERQLIFAAPPFTILVAAGITRLWRACSLAAGVVAAATIVAAALSLHGFYSIPRYVDDDYRPILAQVGARQAPGDAWLAIYPWQIGYLRAYLPERQPEIIVVPLDWSRDEAARVAGVRRLLAAHPRVWFPAFQMQGRQLEERLARTLHEVGVPVWDEWFGTTRLWLTAAPPTGEARAVEREFAGQIRLVSVVGGDDPVASGNGVAPLILTFDGDTGGLRANLQLLGAASVWGEWDGPLVESLRLGLPIDAGTPPGSYEMRLSLYRAADGASLDWLDNGAPAGTAAPIGTLQVVRPAGPLPLTALPVAWPQAVRVGKAIDFAGAAVPTDTLRTGDPLLVTLFWRAARDMERDLQVFVQLIAPDGAVLAASDQPPVAGHFPTSRWHAGDLIRDTHNLLVPADLPGGRYRLIAGLYDPATGRREPVAGGQDSLALGTVTIEPRAHSFEKPPLARSVDVALGVPPVARLVGVAADPAGIPTEIEAGATLPVTLVWRPEQTPTGPVRAFVQLLDEHDQLGGLSDQPAGSGPATGWVAGEYLSDTHVVAVRPEAAGRYRLVAGLYDPASGARFVTEAGAGFVELGMVEVK